MQRGLSYAIVDEVDSILIDEARTPLIISGQAEDSTELYYRMNEIVPKLIRVKEENGPGDFTVDEKAHQVLLTEAGHERAEDLLTRAGLLPENGSLYDAANINLMHHLYAALRANSLFHRDQHYVDQNDEIIIVDEFTGRLTPGTALVGRVASGRWKPRKGFAFSAKIRRWPRLPIRIISGCTRSFPA